MFSTDEEETYQYLVKKKGTGFEKIESKQRIGREQKGNKRTKK